MRRGRDKAGTGRVGRNRFPQGARRAGSGGPLRPVGPGSARVCGNPDVSPRKASRSCVWLGDGNEMGSGRVRRYGRPGRARSTSSPGLIGPRRTPIRGRPDIAVCGDADEVCSARIRSHVNPALRRSGSPRRLVHPRPTRVHRSPDIASGNEEAGSCRVRARGGSSYTGRGGGQRPSIDPCRAAVR